MGCKQAELIRNMPSQSVIVKIQQFQVLKLGNCLRYFPLEVVVMHNEALEFYTVH